jgi:hypothetical protein
MALNPFKMNAGDRKLLKHGIHAQARLLEFKTTGTTINDRRVVCKVTIELETKDGSTVRATGKLPILLWNVDKWSVGDSLPICYDPKNPEKWTHGDEANAPADPAPNTGAGAAPCAGIPGMGAPGAILGGVQVVNASGEDPSTVMAKLTRLRDQGLINDAQLEAAQQQVAGGVGATAAQVPIAAERLQQLDQLRNQALISDEEYAAERQRILDSI